MSRGRSKIIAVRFAGWPTLLLIVAAVVACSLHSGNAAPAATPAVKKAFNPHWKANGCASCHTPEFQDKNGAPVKIPVNKADAVCLSCHDGEKATAEAHPTDRPYDTKKYAKPGSWPLADGRLACLTCHDVLMGCNHKVTRPVANRVFLREQKAMGSATPAGPTTRTGQLKVQQRTVPFCQNCHLEQQYVKVNPHLMLSADRKAALEDKCLMCHEKPLDRGAMTRTGQPSLRSPQEQLCRDCHPGGHKDLALNAHIGRKLSDEVQAYMAYRELVGLAGPGNARVIEQIKAARHRPTKMVGDAQANVTCSTCHNPHQAGVFPRDSALNYLPMREAEHGKVVSPVRSKNYCRHCHEEL
jgi:mono/diheme cytochrome c family protein